MIHRHWNACLHLLSTFSFVEIDTSLQDWMLQYKIHIRNLICQFITVSSWVIWELFKVPSFVWTWTHVHEVHPIELPFGSFWRNRNFVHQSHIQNSMTIVFWRQCLSMFSLTLSNPLIDFARDLVRFLPGNLWNTNWIFSPSNFLADSNVLLDNHSIFLWTWLLVRALLLFPNIRRNLRRRELLHRAFSTVLRRIDKNCLTNPLFSQDLRWRINLQEVSLRFLEMEHPWKKISLVLVTNETGNYSIVPRSSGHPERNLLSILLMRILTRDVAWGFHELSMRNACVKSCGHHLFHKIVWCATEYNNDCHCIVVKIPFVNNIRQLIRCSHVFYQNRMIQFHTLSNNQSRSTLCVSCDVPQVQTFVLCWSFGPLPHGHRRGWVGLSVSCWECWVERGQCMEIHNCENANETGMTLSRCVTFKVSPRLILLDNVSNTHTSTL